MYSSCRIKKHLFLFLCILFSVCCLSFSFAEEAVNITENTQISVNFAPKEVKYMLNKNYRNGWYMRKGGVITFHTDTPCENLYMQFGITMKDFVLEEKVEGKWTPFYQKDEAYINDVFPIGGRTDFRFKSKNTIKVINLELFAQGELPAHVQKWSEPAEKADILLIVAHPDDEILWFGGLMPYYAGELGKKVQVVFMTSEPGYRRNELLDCIWTCGVKNYPIMGIYKDKRTYEINDAFSFFGGEKNSSLYIASLIRKFKPEIVITHDFHGEYGHNAHKATAKATQNAIFLSSDETQTSSKLKNLPPHQVKKFYVHLSDENPIYLDYNIPLPSALCRRGI